MLAPLQEPPSPASAAETGASRQLRALGTSRDALAIVSCSGFAPRASSGRSCCPPRACPACDGGPLAGGRAWVPRKGVPVRSACGQWLQRRGRGDALTGLALSPPPAPPPQRGVAARLRLSLGGASSEAKPHLRGAGRTPLQTCNSCVLTTHEGQAWAPPQTSWLSGSRAFPSHHVACLSLQKLLQRKHPGPGCSRRASAQPRGSGGREKGPLGLLPAGVGVAWGEEQLEGGRETGGPDPRPPPPRPPPPPHPGSRECPRLECKPAVGAVHTWRRRWFICEIGVVHKKVSLLGATNIR